MRRIVVVFIVALLVVMMVPVAPLGATPPSDVAIRVDNESPDDLVSPFTADSGGLICEFGEVETIAASAAGMQSGKGVNLQVFKLFTCEDDGTFDAGDTFTLKLQVRIAADGAKFHWTVVDGTGAFEDLHGSGDGYAKDACPLEEPDCGSFTDFYEGKMHID